MTATTPSGGRPQGGPPLIIPIVAYGVLMVVGVILSAKVPQPSASATSVLTYNRTHHDVLEFGGFFAFAASLPLAIWTAAVYRRLRTNLGITAPGAVIALVGGLLAAASLSLTGLLNWASSQIPTTGDPTVARALTDLSFATGSAGFVAPLGLLTAGIAVPGLLGRILPRTAAWIGLIIAAVCELSAFALLTSALYFTFPIGRFVGLIWLIVVSVILPANRHAIRNSAAGNQSQPAPA